MTNVGHVETVLELSPLQNGLLFHDVLEDSRRSYVGVFRFRLNGRIDPEAVVRAWPRVCARHEALRATFHWRDAGAPIQMIWKNTPTRFDYRDLRGWSAAAVETCCAARIDQERAQGFDLTEAPLIRVSLFRVQDTAYELIVANHHIVLDGWSLHILFAELFGGFQEEPPRYSEFLAWLRTCDRQEMERFWRDKLAGVGAPTALNLPPRDPGTPPTGGQRTVARVLPPQLIARLVEVARHRGLTLNTVFTSAWALVLSRYSGESDVVLGVTTSGRTGCFPGIDRIVGLLINTVPVPVSVPTTLEWNEWARRLQAELSDIREHELMSLVDMKKLTRIESSSVRLFDSILVFQNQPSVDAPVEGVRLEAVSSHEHVGYPLTLTIERAGDTFEISAEFDVGMFEPAGIERLLVHIEYVLAGVGESPDSPVGRIEMLPSAEREHLASVAHRGLPHDRDWLIEEAIDHYAETTPDAPAIASQGGSVSYLELARRSSQLARYLIECGVTRNTLVAVCVERSAAAVTAILGVLRAGGTYVPVDSSYPPARISYLLGRCGAPVVLVSDSTMPLVASSSARAVDLTRVWPSLPAGDSVSPRPVRARSDPAYVIFTSGSTGQPNGVVASCGNLAHVVAATRTRFELSAADRCLQFCSLNFDSSVTDLFGILAAGGTLVVPPWRLPDSIEQFERLVCDQAITCVDLPTAFWHHWVNQMAPDSPVLSSALRLTMVGGEAWQPRLVAKWNRLVGRRIQLANNYGPTETTVNATGYGPEDRVEDEERAVLIGTPYGDASVHVLDPCLRRMPLAVAGEICIGGPGVTLGYLNDPDTTSASFVPDPFTGDGRLYKTGDRGRWRPDGHLEFLGRRDDQIKIRGYRVEPREIERVLLMHDRVHQAVAGAHDHGRGAEIVAHVVCDASVTSAELRSFTQSHLPEYCVPSSFVFMPQLLLTPGGKIERRGLPVPAKSPTLSIGEAPRYALEEIMIGIWADVLALDQAGRHDDFFVHGGHSLLAMQLVARIRSVLNTEVPLRTVFANPTPALLAQQVATQSHGAVMPPVTRIDRNGTLELSFAQQRLWFMDQLEPQSALYNIPLALKVTGPLDIAALERAINAIIARHEALRTTFPRVDDGPIQLIADAYELRIAREDLSSLSDAKRADAATHLARHAALAPFDLAAGPVLRCLLVTYAPESHLIVLTMHHIVSDAWSCNIFLAELSAAYSAIVQGRMPPLPELPVQPVDYAAWQRQLVTGSLLEKELAYWRKQLDGARGWIDLPTAQPRSEAVSFRGAVKTFDLGAAMSEALLALSRRQGATLYMMLLAAFAVLLNRYTGDEDLVIGSPVANREQVEIESLIGFFVNMVALRIDLRGSPTFAELLQRVRDVTLGASEHQQVPFDRVVEELHPERSRRRHPIFQVMCTLDRKTAAEDCRLGDATVELRDVDVESCKFDLALHFTQRAGISGLFSYRTDLFDAETIDRMIGHFEQVLAAIVADATAPIASLTILTDAEREERRHWNDTAIADDPGRLVHHLVEAEVEIGAGRAAVVFEGRELDYAELDRRANQLARHLIALDAGPDVVVAVLSDRCLDLPVVLLGVLKAGAAYLMIDAAHPPERVAFMLEDSGAAILVINGHRSTEVPESVRVVRLPDEWPAIDRQPNTRPTSPVAANHLAYLVYTSGSTGAPKAVMIEHGALLNHMLWMMRTFARAEHEVVLHKTPLSFDASVWEIWLPLLAGVTLAIARPNDHKDPRQLVETIQRHSVTTLQVVPSLLRVLVDCEEFRACCTLRRVFCGGEVLDAGLVRRFMDIHPSVELHNLYGPTEATIDATSWRCRREDAITPIGRPVSNTVLRIVDGAGHDVPVGVVGELHVGGKSVARGYLNRDELTAQRFYTDADGVRFYRTGDLARFHADGTIEYVGRSDHQVKLRGFRVELEEIEARLRRHSAVVDAAVVVSHAADVPFLVAYVTCADATSDGDLRWFLLQWLPVYMVPAVYVFVDRMPLSPNGKIDRAALPPPNRASHRAHVEPRDHTEERLAALWKDVLGLDDIGIHDNFFELGGHSLLALQLLSKMKRTLGVDIPLGRLFDLPTIAEVAGEVRAQGESAPA